MGRYSTRTRLSMLLTQREFTELGRALEEIYPLGKSFLMLEAIRAGIMESEEDVPDTKRICRVRFWLPTEFADKMRELSELKATSQQSLMRHFLFQYLADPPWKKNSSVKRKSISKSRNRRMRFNSTIKK